MPALTLFGNTPTAPPVVLVPARRFARNSETMPSPTLDGSGKPVNWLPTSVVNEEYGTLQVLVGGVDVTQFRFVPTLVDDWSSLEPYQDATATLSFGSITPFEALGAGALFWLTDFALVVINARKADGSTKTLWAGLVAPTEDSVTESGFVLKVRCIGLLHQLGFYVRAPGISDLGVDIGSLIAGQWRALTRPALRTADMAVVVTGIMSGYRGAWESALDYVTKLLEFSLQPDGSSHTVDLDYPNTPVLRPKDRTTVHWTVHTGGRGIAQDLHHESTTAANVYYGEGIDASGATWRSMFPFGVSGAEVFFEPLAYDTRVHPIDIDAAGELVQHPERIDPAIVRIEAYTNFGTTTFGDGQASAVAFYNQRKDPGILGTITLTSDPQEGSRLEIRAGQNIKLRGYRGADVLFHIVGVTQKIDEKGVTTTLTVDTKARNLPSIVEILARKAALAKNPVARLQIGSTSGTRKDVYVPWDQAHGSGTLPNGSKTSGDSTPPNIALGKRWVDGISTVPTTAGQWVIVPMLASERDTIIRARVVCSVDCAFHVSIYDREPFAGGLTGLPANPFAIGAWDDPSLLPSGRLAGWGGAGQRCGFYPFVEADENGPTGKPTTGIFEDDGQWQITHDQAALLAGDSNPAYVWVALFVDPASYVGDLNFHMELTRGVGY